MSEKSFSSGSLVDRNPSKGTEPSPVGIAQSEFAQKQRKLFDLVHKLHNTGIQSEIDLPKICVVGSQSAGKSSLIESISGIKLPRATGTCTRCPIECRLSYSSKPWECRVNLRFHKDRKGDEIQTILIPCGEVITQKEEVEERIRLAQQAILNPSQYLSQTAGGTVVLEKPAAGQKAATASTFSENCVLVEISGPDVTDLSFCDLPGIIASVGDGGREGDIELVKALVSSYIKKDNCIILLAVTCETDIDNQGACKLAKEFDPQGKRTIGVLTKPDRIETNQEHTWLSFIRGDSGPLPKGWFCVKQPSPVELEEKLTWSEARRREEAFFSTRQPWSSQSLDVRNRFGTARLTSRLTEILFDMIATFLPSLKEKIQHMSDETIKGLRSLPQEASDDPAATVLNLIMSFHRDINMHVEGVPNGDGLIQQLRAAQDKFRKAIKASTPEFRPYKRKSEDAKYRMPKISFLTEDESDLEPVSGRRLYEDDISKLSAEAVTRELPKNVPFIVKRKLIKQFVELWDEPTNAFLDEVEAIISAYMQKFVDSFFKQHSFGGLHSAVGEVVVNRIEQCRKNSDAQTRFLLGIENNQTFTTNTHYLADYKEKFTTYYNSARSIRNKNKFIQNLVDGAQGEGSATEHVNEIMSRLAQLGLSIEPGQLAKLTDSDGAEDIIDIMAEVRAYYQVAYKRFVDVIPMAIDETMVRGFARDLEQRLFEDLGVSGDNSRKRCADFLADPHEITRERDMLKLRRDRLALAKREIGKVWS